MTEDIYIKRYLMKNKLLNKIVVQYKIRDKTVISVGATLAVAQISYVVFYVLYGTAYSTSRFGYIF